ncbi:TetR family transcriptional regulator [Microbacterium sp. A94]|uniref:TetR family transcriptional regulator n=1 Tax=Microbacterium sp. A94 TaxID=3450717 RepID=UPI003F43040D
MTKTVRERSRDLMRAELAEAVYDYFAAHGFDEVTVDEVAHNVGISRATFFRYFGSKEEAVIVAVHSSPIDFAGTLQSLERQGKESIWSLLRRMFAPSVADVESRPEALRARLRMINSTPTLKARLAERRTSQIAVVAEVLEGAAPDALAARALAATAFALFDVAWLAWAASEDRTFRTILDDLFERFAPAAEATLG